MTPLIALVTAVAAFVVLIECGKRIVRSVSVLARSFRVSEFVLSFVLIAFATSLPELSVGINAAISGVPELSLGDIIGTNIINITLVLGVIAVMSGAISVRDYDTFSHNRLFQLTIVLAPFILLMDGTLSRGDGFILLGLLLVHLIRLLHIDEHIWHRKVLRPHLVSSATAAPESDVSVWRQGIILAVALPLMVGATYVVVYTAKLWAELLAVPVVLVGVLVVATATSLPELIIGMRSARTQHGGVAIGDIFGAAAINASLILGVVAIIHPIELQETAILWSGLGFTMFAFLLVYIFLHTKRTIVRWEGWVLILCYALFVSVQLISLL